MRKGFNFPDLFNRSTGSTNVVEGVELISSNLRLLLSSNKDVLLFHPDFGVDFNNLILSLPDKVNEDILRDMIEQGLKKYGRVVLKGVNIKRQGSVATVVISFRVVNSQLEFEIERDLEG